MTRAGFFLEGGVGIGRSVKEDVFLSSSLRAGGILSLSERVALAPFGEFGLMRDSARLVNVGVESQWYVPGVFKNLYCYLPLFAGRQGEAYHAGVGLGVGGTLWNGERVDLDLIVESNARHSWSDRLWTYQYGLLAIRFVLGQDSPAIKKMERRPQSPVVVLKPTEKKVVKIEIKKEKPPEEKQEELVADYLKKILSRGPSGYLYFSDAALVDFEETVLIPLAQGGRLEELREGLEVFYRLNAPPLDHEWEKNFYALFVLKEFLGFSLEKPPGFRYSRSEMEEKLEEVFYTDEAGKKPMVMNKTKLGINLYLQVLLKTERPVAAPDDALLGFLHAIGCRRPWIEALKQKLGSTKK